MKKAAVVIAMLICFLLFGCTASNERQNAEPSIATPSQTQPAASLEVISLSDRVDTYLQKNKFSGSVLLAKKGNILIRQGYGSASQELNSPNTPRTIFRIGSVTKQFTAIAIMQLQEQGKLNVKDSIHKYLPDFQNGDIITIHHLLTHTSGIPNFTGFPDYLDTMGQHVTVEQNLAKFKDKPLDFEPGSMFNSSSAHNSEAKIDF